MSGTLHLSSMLSSMLIQKCSLFFADLVTIVGLTPRWKGSHFSRKSREHLALASASLGALFLLDIASSAFFYPACCILARKVVATSSNFELSNSTWFHHLALSRLFRSALCNCSMTPDEFLLAIMNSCDASSSPEDSISVAVQL